jgi:LmbE family N-acetylglucosaminyl deacetylase
MPFFLFGEEMERLTLLLMVITAAAAAPPGQTLPGSAAKKDTPYVLLVLAHPDDEYDMAATVYRITTELQGTADEIILTDGEAGYHYSSLAERYYGVALADESAGRARLARIRVEESRRAAKVLGIRHQWFLGEKNIPFTPSPDAPLHSSWNRKRILQSISQRLKEDHYEFVLVLLPEPQTHGEHKAATILTLEAVHSLPEKNRPVVLGAMAGNGVDATYEAVPGQPLTQPLTAEPEFHFDRNVHFGYQQSLSYQIVVDWVIAEHKSQGLFQTKCLQDRFENFWIFDTGVAEAAEKAAALFDEISPGTARSAQADAGSQTDSHH